MTLVSKALLTLCFAAIPMAAQALAPVELVKSAAANEVKATEHPSSSWMYRLTKESKSGTQVKDMVETKDGIVARYVSVNGRAITEAERASENTHLESLARDPAERQRKFGDQQKEQARFLALVRALPDALLYTTDGNEQLDGRDTVRLAFRPNPAFHTTTRETIIFRASEGHIWIDPLENRIVKFDGITTSDINIGWGLLGHIDKGSKLQIEQRRLAEGQWRLTHLVLEGNGQILFFKSITLKQRQMATDFRPVNKDLTVAAAIELLKKQPVTEAQNAPR